MSRSVVSQVVPHAPPSTDAVPQRKGQLTLFDVRDFGNLHFLISPIAHRTVAAVPGDGPSAVTSLTDPDTVISQLNVALPAAAPWPLPNSSS